MAAKYSLNKLNIFLLIVISISLSFNIVFYFSSGELEKDIETISSPETIETLESEKPTEEEINKDSVIIFTVQSGDTLLKIFSDAGIAPEVGHVISNAINKVFALSKLKIGNQVEIKFLIESDKSDDYYSKVDFIKLTSGEKQVEVQYDEANNSYSAKLIEIPLTLKEVFHHGTISDSLYLSATNAGISPNIILEFIKLFSYDVDFQRDIQPGDGFEAYYSYYVNDQGQKFREGNLIYASLTLCGKKKDIYRFEIEPDVVDYFNTSGESIKKTLLRTPINGAKISSGYGIRKHPILGYSKMHKGLDYAAPRGTPVLAAGDGIIHMVKAIKTGYGKHIEIKHSSKYSTFYAHLDRFAPNIKKGTRVSQGDIIGFVGSTGMATGPHLHYEVHERNVQVNPVKVSFPKSPPLQDKKLQEFKHHQQSLASKISTMKSDINSNPSLVKK